MDNSTIAGTLSDYSIIQGFLWNPTGLPWSRLLIAFLVISLGTWAYFPKSDGLIAPFVGYSSSWEPGFIARLRFTFRSPSIISEGYSKSRDSTYRISRTDGDVIVIPRKYLDELHNAPPERLSSIQGLIKNFGGKYSGITLLGESEIGTRALQSKITPRLVQFTDVMRDELDYAIQKVLPDCQDWTSVSIQPMMLNLIERVTNRVFVGLPLCRNEEWLDALHRHAHNVTLTQVSMRLFPLFVRPLLNLVLPAAHRYRAAVRDSKRILVPEIERRRRLEESDPDYEKPQDLLQAIMDLSTQGDKNSEPDNVAHRHLLVTLVAGHSVAAAGCQAVFDLVSRPEYIEILRDEVLEVLRRDGGEWNKQTLGKLWKMDSFLRESQRWNPPSLLGFHRIVQDPEGFVLHDGVRLPPGAHVCITPASFGHDPSVIARADEFDGLRYYAQRMRGPDEANKHQHATVDREHMHFGYGSWSCPGRFLASAELKLILVELLLRWELRYPEGKSGPAKSSIEEFPYIDVNTPLLMKRRTAAM
ncbi:hypothetical protein HIM_07569 [Hirsutella minnesotensis 3608]|uniref:Uncharacterized protein n=1 Tax=Hirsutella minnesotensis 3608 TaxID=1043627 RepID=A0A0F7ZYS8_9HYPO|nr:hypothetical protein HIM_07569 [Hirsutella minnesotensis 3608]